ncbi:MAG: hypothetical protein FWB76_05170 [Oscillospiraceae bacterium]|nr:hypothetical protein [Oscillospiraceae bacterium]
MAKRILATVLALVMALGLFAVVAAANPNNAPRITQAPSGVLILVSGDEYTLRANAVIPAGGARGTLTYEWQVARRGLFGEGSWETIGTGQNFVFTGRNNTSIPNLVGSGPTWGENFRVLVTNTFTQGGVQQTASTASEPFNIQVYSSSTFRQWFSPMRPYRGRFLDTMGYYALNSILSGLPATVFTWWSVINRRSVISDRAV